MFAGINYELIANFEPFFYFVSLSCVILPLLSFNQFPLFACAPLQEAHGESVGNWLI